MIVSEWTCRTDGAVMRMTFCDPDSRNRLTTPMLEEARALLTEAVIDGVRVVILRAEPVKGPGPAATTSAKFRPR